MVADSANSGYTAIPYRVSTGPEQGFPCVLFPNREKPVFITGIPANGNRFFPVRKSTQGKPCFLLQGWVCSVFVATQSILSNYSIMSVFHISTQKVRSYFNNV